MLDIHGLEDKLYDDHIANASMERQESFCLSDDDEYIAKMED